MTFGLPARGSRLPEPEGGGDDFDLLRRIVVGREQTSIRELELRLEALERTIKEQNRRTAQALLDQKEDAVAQAGPAALDWMRQLEGRADAPWEAVGTAMALPVEEGLKAGAARHPESLARALSPVVASAARVSVAEFLQRCFFRLDSLLHHLLPFRKIWDRLKAARSGLSAAEFAARQASGFRVAKVQLLERGDDSLVREVAIPAAYRRNSPADEKPASDSAKDTLRLAGEHFVLQVKSLGPVDPELEAEAAAGLKMIEDRFGLVLDMQALRPAESLELERILHQLLNFGGPPQRSPWLAGVLVTAAVIGLGIWSGAILKQRMRERNLLESLRNQPGIVVLDTSHRGGRFFVSGLRDPMAPDPITFLAGSMLSMDSVVFEFAPYYSVGTEYDILRKADAQRREVEASAATVRRVESTISAYREKVAEFERHRRSAVERHLTDALGGGVPPEVKWDWADGMLMVSGVAPQRAVTQLTDAVAGLKGVAQVDLTGLAAAPEEANPARLLPSLDVPFVGATGQFDPAAAQELDRMASIIRKCDAASIKPTKLRLRAAPVPGESTAESREKQQARMAAVRKELERRGIAAGRFVSGLAEQKGQSSRRGVGVEQAAE